MQTRPGPIDGALREALRGTLLDQGFVAARFTGADPVADGLSAWVAAGRHAGMAYMARDPALRADPDRLLPGCRTVVCVAAAYPAARAPGPDGPAPVAAYARGEDYHRTLKAALSRALEGWPALLGHAPATRLCVDSLPLLERAFAARAGLGWIGRNTMLLDEAHGPWLLLAEVLTDLEVAPDEPVAERCGTCTACVEACPTGALDGDGGLDARRCLSYWTIEHRGELPEAWERAAEGRVFGCDDCLSACPFPRREAALPEGGPFEPRPDLAAADRDQLEALARASFRRHFASTPLERVRKHGLLRNLAAARRQAGGDGRTTPPTV